MAILDELYLAGSCHIVVELVEYDALLAVQDIKSCAFDSCDGVLVEDIVVFDLLSRVGVGINMVAHTLNFFRVRIYFYCSVSGHRASLPIVLLTS
ncbi:hypothetical protein PanWU01x14_186310 [Parasponia andersonii]|uniref:Uncharacterized protein n=1 Tax=Parasponia andersonii TaxID=3476 RepID=A0A2P5C3U2_PARAD|nr:hypothetical protein PanWU01x14_186310 [Parasponia andersonii]